jgi:hypothetical protein
MGAFIRATKPGTSARQPLEMVAAPVAEAAACCAPGCCS